MIDKAHRNDLSTQSTQSTLNLDIVGFGRSIELLETLYRLGSISFVRNVRAV